MNIKFTTKHPQAVIEQNMVINGEIVGWIEQKQTDLGGTRFHCGFKIQNSYFSLIQGHGETPEEAINDAIVTARKNAARLLDAIEVLEAKLSSEG